MTWINSQEVLSRGETKMQENTFCAMPCKKENTDVPICLCVRGSVRRGGKEEVWQAAPSAVMRVI